MDDVEQEENEGKSHADLTSDAEAKQEVMLRDEPFSLDSLLLYKVKRAFFEDETGRKQKFDKPVRVLKYTELYLPQGKNSEARRAMVDYNRMVMDRGIVQPSQAFEEKMAMRKRDIKA